MRVLLIEDEERIATLVRRGLRAEGIDVVHREDGPAGILAFSRERFDAVILDNLLPGPDGIAVLRELRERSAVAPVIMLSARRDVATKVAALRAGASDYVVKPFELAELAERLRVHVRLAEGTSAGDALERAGDLVLDPVERVVHADHGPIQLTEQEARLLRHLMRHAGRVVPRERLLADVWGYRHDPGATNVVDVYVKRLRAKLGADAVRTVRGVGYCLDD